MLSIHWIDPKVPCKETCHKDATESVFFTLVKMRYALSRLHSNGAVHGDFNDTRLIVNNN